MQKVTNIGVPFGPHSTPSCNMIAANAFLFQIATWNSLFEMALGTSIFENNFHTFMQPFSPNLTYK